MGKSEEPGKRLQRIIAQERVTVTSWVLSPTIPMKDHGSSVSHQKNLAILAVTSINCLDER